MADTPFGKISHRKPTSDSRHPVLIHRTVHRPGMTDHLIAKTKTYDHVFVNAAEKYLPAVDWRLLKAQCFQESAFNTNAVSPVGAQGLMQIMPGTWEEMASKCAEADDPFDAHDSIYTGAAYMEEMLKVWKWERPEADRYALALASYNAGAGNLIEAQRLVGDPVLYSAIIRGLFAVTGHHSEETINYVKSIFYYYQLQIVG